MHAQQSTVIYLDSCDYSNLSHPKLDAAKIEQLGALRALKKRSDTVFVYSGAHISEMSPLDQQYANAAVARTELMVELCGRSTMIAYDRLLRAELTRLVERDPHPVGVLDSNGGWFPDMGSLMSPLDELDLKGMMKAQVDKQQLSRKVRRFANAALMKNGGFRRSFEERTGDLDMTGLQDKMPMRPKDAMVIKRYILGKATRQQADKAFLESLRDPTFMSHWFIHHHHQMGAIIEWVRRPAQELLDNCNQTLTDLAENLAKLPEAERAKAMKDVSGERWAKFRKQGMLDIVNRLLANVFPGETAVRKRGFGGAVLPRHLCLHQRILQLASEFFGGKRPRAKGLRLRRHHSRSLRPVRVVLQSRSLHVLRAAAACWALWYAGRGVTSKAH
ncbi:hypothetical protein ACIP01_22025 [Pseudomonas monteilii]|uniref:hypothetical protein n=1 Tax=Pseudomonas monteilii TaxID=76759 RepID=UPI00382CBA65